MKKVIYADIHALGEREENLKSQVSSYLDQGADGYYIYDFSADEAARDRFLHMVRGIHTEVELPFVVGIHANRFEDVKKALYTGAERVYLRLDSEGSARKEALERFGDKVGLELDYSRGQCSKEVLESLSGQGITHVILKHVDADAVLREKLAQYPELTVMFRDSLRRNDLVDLLSMETVCGLATNFYREKDIRKAKRLLREQGMETGGLACQMAFSDLKTGPDGLVPVIVQDYKNDEVLMLAYMNEESYNKTIETGKMTYYSRSRKELWCKGDTSGHYQYVKELTIDCDRDTILARVRQMGAACHTGNRSCFYTELATASAQAPAGRLNVLQEVYDTILDRKAHPKEGSYTNYLFEKGIDKILKKCGEESAEIIIAAKNPDAIELKYEVADYLYHLMVLMAETGLSWEEIMEELANRH